MSTKFPPARLAELRAHGFDAVELLHLRGLAPGDTLMALGLGIARLMGTQLQVTTLTSLDLGLRHLTDAIRSDVRIYWRERDRNTS